MKAILELEMPKSCWDCPFVKIPHGCDYIAGSDVPLKNLYVVCTVTRRAVHRVEAMIADDGNYCDYKKERAPLCPLMSVDDGATQEGCAP